MRTLKRQHTVRNRFRQSCGVNYRAPPHVKLLESKRNIVPANTVNPVKQGRILDKRELRHANQLCRWFGNVRQRRVGILPHDVAQLVILLRGQSVFINRGVIIVRRNVGSEARRVGSRPMAERRSAVSHVQRKGYVL